MVKIFRTKIAIVGVALALGGCAHVVPTTTVAPPKQPFQSTQPTVQSTVAEKRAPAVQMQIFLDTNHFRPGMVDGRSGELRVRQLEKGALYSKARRLCLWVRHEECGSEYQDRAA